MTTTDQTVVTSGDTASKKDVPLTIFLHIPKAAGITLRHIAEQQYGGDELCKAGNAMRNSGQSTSLIEECVAQYGATLRFVEGHLRFGVHELLPRPATYFTLLRDPVERVISHYYYFLADAEGSEGIDQALVEGSHLIDNLQTRLLSGMATQFGQCSRELPEDMPLIQRSSPDFEPCTPEMLKAAKQNLRERFSLIGLVESFDESLLMLRRMLGWQDVLYVPQNVTESRPQRKQLPRRTILAIERHNRLDRELYKYARTLFEEQIAREGPDFAAEVEAFRTVNRWWGQVSAAAAESELPEAPETLLPAAAEAPSGLQRACARVFLLEGELSGRISAAGPFESRAQATLRQHKRVDELLATIAGNDALARSREVELAEKLERVKAAAEALQVEVKELRSQVREQSEEAERLRGALAEQQQQTQTVQAREQELSGQLTQAQSRNANLRRDNERLAAREANAQKHVKELTERVGELEQQNAGMQEREDAFRAEITWLREQRTWMNERHEDDRLQVGVLRESFAGLKQDLARATAQREEDERALGELTRTVTALREGEGQMREQIDGLRARNADLQRELSEVQTREAALADRIERLQSQRTELKHHIQGIRPAKVASKRT